MPLFAKHFTVAQARAALPELRRRLRRIQDLLAEIRARLEQQGQGPPIVLRGNGKGPLITETDEDAHKQEAQSLIEAIADQGIQIKDLQRGLVDFPHFLGGDPDHEVFLCWHLGEDTIDTWHEIADGYADAALSDAIKAHARELGFALCGITTADPPPHHRHYAHWLAQGRAGEMLYLHRQEPKRGDLQQVLPGARSVVCLALNYSLEDGRPEEPTPGSFLADPSRNGKGGAVHHDIASCLTRSLPSRFGRGGEERAGVGSSPTVARYARFDDYHETMGRRLESLLAFIQTQRPDAQGKVYCDTGPVTERDLAMRAGLGWIGKHTNLISRHWGNWLFLGEILLDIPLPPDPPETTHCGTCTRCLPACPTGAITAPYTLDARRCISYLTIELKGSIPVELRPLIGARIYGCDDCLAVCPWNKFARRTDDPDFQPRADLTAPDLLELLALDDAAFRLKFQNNPIRRTKRRGLLRNVCVALGNLGDPRALPALRRAAETDPEPLVREHAQWAIGQITARK